MNKALGKLYTGPKGENIVTIKQTPSSIHLRIGRKMGFGLSPLNHTEVVQFHIYF